MKTMTAVVAQCVCASMVCAQYAFWSLGQVAGSTQTRAFAVSNDGLVCGTAGSSVFRWDAASGFTMVPGATSVRDVSADGAVMVGNGGRWRLSTQAWEPLLAAQCVNLCTPTEPCIVCGAVQDVAAVDSAGSLVVGRADNLAIAGEGRPAYWYSWSQNALLLPATCTDAYYDQSRMYAARCVSGNGQYVGGVDLGLHIGLTCGGGTVWDFTTGTIEHIAMLHGLFGEVRAVSNNGDVVAGIDSVGVPVGGPYGPVARRVVRSTSSSMVIDGEVPPVGAYKPVMSGMSDDGSRIAGYRTTYNGVTNFGAWIWAEDVGRREFLEFLEERGLGSAVQGWTLTTIRDISHDGRFVCGDGVAPDGRLTAWLAQLPENLRVCDTIDFNNDTLFPDTMDIQDFLSVFSGGPCSTGACNDIDFNNDGLFPDTTDIAALIWVFSGGACL